MAQHTPQPKKKKKEPTTKSQEERINSRLDEAKAPTEGVGGYRLMDLPIGETSDMCLRESMMMLSETLSLSLCIYSNFFFSFRPGPNVFVIICPIHHLYVSRRST
jgi:hypothetical protein